MKLFFLTHVHERAPAAAVAEEGRKSVRALRRIDPRARLADLVVLGLIAADKTLPTGAVKASIDHEGAQCDVFKAKSQTDTGAYTGSDELPSRPADRKRESVSVPPVSGQMQQRPRK